MALTPAEVTHLYESILFRAPNTHELNVGQGSTADALTDQLIATSAVDVQPFILLYQAAFNRIPDAVGTDEEGLGYWVNEYRAGDLNLWDYTARIVDTPEFDLVFDGIPVADAVNQIYQNALGRNAEAAGLNFWVEQINSGNKTLTDVLYDISQTPESKARNLAAAENLQAEVAAGNADFDGNGTLQDFAPPAPVEPAADHFLTPLQDKPALKDGDTVYGTSATYTAGDIIEGNSSNTVRLELSGYVNPSNAKITGVGEVAIEAIGDAGVNTRGWSGVKTITLDSVTDNFALDDLQESATQVDIVDANNVAQVISLNYDASKAGFTGVANIGVAETFGSVKLGTTGNVSRNIETINLSINDNAQDGDSTLKALIGKGTKDLNIDGGYEGGKFTITDALDKTLTKLDASTVKSDLDLNISGENGQRAALNAKLGEGDDVLRAGDSLQNGDVFHGGAGDDKLVADLATLKSLNFKSDSIETFDLTFNSNSSVNFSKVEDLKTINIAEGTDRFDLKQLAHNFTDLNVAGKQADGYHVVEYRGNAINQPKTTLNVNWTNESGNNGESGWVKALWDEFVETGTINLGPNNAYLFDDVKAKTGVDLEEVQAQLNQGANPATLLPEIFKLLTSLWYVDTAGALGIKNAETFNFVHDGEFDTWFKSLDYVVTNDAWQFDIDQPYHVTKTLSVVNEGRGDLELKGGLIYSVGEIVEEALDIVQQQPVPGIPVDGFVDFFVRLAVNTVASGRGNIGGTNAVTDLSFETQDTGSIALNDVRNVRDLTNLTLNATDGDVLVNSVGFGFGIGANNPAAFDAARDITEVNISASNRATAELNFLNGLADLTSPYVANGATIGTINLHAANRSTVILDGVATGDISTTNIQIDNGGEVRVNTWLLANAFSQGTSGGNLVVKGAGTLNEDGAGGYWVFAAQGIKNQDFSGLTTDTVHVAFLNDTQGVNFVGTDNTGRAFEVAPEIELAGGVLGHLGGHEFTNAAGEVFYGIEVRGDAVLGGKGNDTFKTGAGDDFVYTGNGNDVVDLGAGDDFVVTGLFGRNDITLGEGKDTVYLNNVGTRSNGLEANNIITDFLSTQDKIVIDISNINAALDFDLVNGDGSALDELDATVFQTVGGASAVLDNANVLNITGSYASLAALQQAIQHGGSRELRRDHADWDDGDDAILVTWYNSSTKAVHLSAATVFDEVVAGGNNTYNFEVVDIVQLTGVSNLSDLNQTNLDWVD